MLLILTSSLFCFGAELRLPSANLLELDHDHNSNGHYSFDRVEVFYDGDRIHQFDFRRQQDPDYRELATNCYARLNLVKRSAKGPLILDTEKRCLDPKVLREVGEPKEPELLRRVEALEERVLKLEERRN